MGGTKRLIPAAALLVAVLLAATAWAEEYPTLGMCTGSSVRIREEPDTDSRIVGKLDDYDQFVLLGETSVEGDTWYEIDNPTGAGTAWVFGKYVDTYKGDALETPGFAMQVAVIRSFGIAPAKARAIFGKPSKETMEKFHFDPANRDMIRRELSWSTHNAEYVDDRLCRVRVTKGIMPFGNIRIGDPESKVRDLLGDPSGDDPDEGLSWEIDPIHFLYFKIQNGCVTSMTYAAYLDA